MLAVSKIRAIAGNFRDRIALYGEIGASMMKARGISVYRNFDSRIFTDDFITGKTTLERVREIIKQSECVPENL